MRFVGLLLVGLGGLILWAEINGRDPLQLLKQMRELFGHQHLTPVNESPQTSLGRILGQRAQEASAKQAAEAAANQTQEKAGTRRPGAPF